MAALKILGATYGPAVVTDIVRSLVKNNSLTVTADTRTFGDPWRGRAKCLVVVYQYDENPPGVFILKGNTSGTVSLPAAQAAWHPEPDGRLTILGAAYGPSDVTEEVKRRIKDNGVDLAANNDYFKDSWVGKDKTLTIVYQYNGLPKVEVVKTRDSMWITDMTEPDPLTSPITRAIFDRIGGLKGPLAQITYDYNSGNQLRFIQTPNVWGQYASPVEATSASKEFLSLIGETAADAGYLLDLTTLWPLPNGRFFRELQEAVKRLHQKDKFIKIRVLAGKPTAAPGYGYPSDPRPEMQRWLQELVALIPADSRLEIYLAAIDPKLASWNHSKIIAVDGRKALVGGHNLWHTDYLGKFPVHDLTLFVEGRAALSAQRYASELWNHVARLSQKHNEGAWAYHWFNGDVSAFAAPPRTDQLDASAAPERKDGYRILSLGNLGKNMGDSKRPGHNASTAAQTAALSQAKTTIKLSQQNLFLRIPGNVVTINHTLIQTLIGRIAAGVQVDVVLTDDNETVYSTGISIEATYQLIKREIWDHNIKIKDEDLNSRLRIAPLRTSDEVPEWVFSNGRGLTNEHKCYANHAKLYIVDDKAFYIGSHNLYWTDLQEFGYFVEDKEQTDTLIRDYWNKVWSYSGSEVYKDRYLNKRWRDYVKYTLIRCN